MPFLYGLTATLLRVISVWGMVTYLPQLPLTFGLFLSTENMDQYQLVTQKSYAIITLLSIPMFILLFIFVRSIARFIVPKGLETTQDTEIHSDALIRVGIILIGLFMIITNIIGAVYFQYDVVIEWIKEMRGMNDPYYEDYNYNPLFPSAGENVIGFYAGILMIVTGLGFHKRMKSIPRTIVKLRG